MARARAWRDANAASSSLLRAHLCDVAELTLESRGRVRGNTPRGSVSEQSTAATGENQSGAEAPRARRLYPPPRPPPLLVRSPDTCRGLMNLRGYLASQRLRGVCRGVLGFFSSCITEELGVSSGCRAAPLLARSPRPFPPPSCLRDNAGTETPLRFGFALLYP